MLLRIFYTIFIALLVAMMVGVGISAFYEAPKAPQYPTTTPSSPTDQDYANQQKEYQKNQEEFDKASSKYNTNVSLISLVAGVVIFALSLLFNTKIKEIGDGLMLGSVFTLLYSIARGFNANNQKLLFLIVLASLLLGVVIGYLKFIKPKKSTEPLT